MNCGRSLEKKHDALHSSTCISTKTCCSTSWHFPWSCCRCAAQPGSRPFNFTTFAYITTQHGPAHRLSNCNIVPCRSLWAALFSSPHVTAALCAAPVRPQHGLTVSNDGTVCMMRHRKKKAQLGLPADQRKALIRSLVTEVLRHGRITTTKVRSFN